METLRLAFNQMLQDEAFSEAIETSMRTSLNPIEGERLEMIVETALSTPDSVINEVKELLGI